MVPIAIGDEYYEDEFQYTAKVLGIQLPSEVPSTGTQKPADASKSPTGIKVPGNIDLHHRPVVQNGNDISTVLSKSFGFDEGEVLIPTVAADGSGLLSDDDAIAQYRKTGQHLGIFDTSDNASTYAQSLHEDQAKEYLPKQGTVNIDDVPHHDWVESMAKGVLKALTLPGDVASGKVQSGSQEEINRAFDLAGTMVFGPAPVASKLADGTLGSFAGVKSAKLNKEKLYEAQNLETSGASADDIWSQTGFMRGADDRWKYEIDDSKSAFKEDAIKLTRIGAERKARDEVAVAERDKLGIPRGWGEIEGKTPEYMHELAKEGVPLSEVFDHPELYEAYPFLKDIQVKATSGFDAMSGIQGYFNPRKNELAVGFATPSEMKSVMLHEIQHVIQKHEGFGFGASPEAFTSDNWKELSTAYNQYVKDTEKTIKEFFPDKANKLSDFREALKREPELDKLAERASYGPASKEQYEKVLGNLEILNSLPQLRENVEKILKGEAIVSRMNKALLEKYKSVKGEVESRNVQTRMKLTAEERKSKSPESTEDFLRSEQINSPLNNR